MTNKNTFMKGYNQNIFDTYNRMKINDENSQDSLKDESCTASACISPSIAGQTYNALTTEDDDASINNKVEDKKLDIAGHIGQKYSKFKENHEGFAKVIGSMKATAAKVKEFGKSSFNMMNSLPEKTIDAFAQQKMSEIKNDPKSIVSLTKQITMGAGRKVAAAGMCIACLPLGIAAIIGNKALDNNVKKRVLTDLNNEYVRIGQELEKADRDGDYDKKADLLIAQAETKKAINKLMYNLELDPRNLTE